MGEFKTKDEKWLPVPGWERSHEVSSLGRVRSISRKKLNRNEMVKGRELKQQIDKWGYHYVFLNYAGKQSSMNVHTLVARAFIGFRPHGYQCDHIDSNKGNNSAANLRYVTPRDNLMARLATGSGVGDRNGRAKIKAAWVNPIRRLAWQGVSRGTIALAFGVSRGAIDGVLSGRCWSHVEEVA